MPSTSSKSSPAVPLVLLAVGLYLVLGNSGGLKLPTLRLPQLGGLTAPAVEPLPEPSPEVRRAVEPLVGLVADAETRRQLAALWRAIAQGVEDDPDRITSTAKARQLNELAGEIYTAANGRRLVLPSGLGEKVDAAFVAAVGGDQGGQLANETITPELRARWCAAFRGIAWALSQG